MRKFVPSSFSFIFSCLIVAVKAVVGEYDKKHDATIIPIVLPIVGFIVIVCVVGCCVQGGCCARDKDKVSPDMQGNTLGRDGVRRGEGVHKLENGRPKQKCKTTPLPGHVTSLNEKPRLPPARKPRTGGSHVAGRNEKHQNGMR